ncbi:MAG TPA: adenylyltransferase [Methanotrichaceae archaeon]|nr:adenylyltransferase [Methanotrichaceae archaeon]
MSERDVAGWTRWSRQMAIPGFGAKAQKKLKHSRVVVLGVGGVGGAAALYLAAAGVGSLVLVDRDEVELTNLNRQVLFSTIDLGRPKAEAGAKRLRSLDPELEVEAVVLDAEEDDLVLLIEGADFVLNCFDENIDRLAANRVCISLAVPASYGFAQDFSGEVFTVLPQLSACLACALDETFPEPEVTPVVGVATGIIGVAMAAAALRSLTGIGDVNAGQRLIYDLAFSELIRIPVPRNPRCPVCGR